MAVQFNPDVTDGNPNGNGIFDLLINSVKLHLKDMYDNNYIRDEDFATLLGTSIQSAMTESSQFVLGLEQARVAALLADADVVNKEFEAELIKQKILTEKGQVEEVEDGLIGLQQDGLEKDLTVKDKEIEVMNQRILSETANVALTNQKVDNLVKEEELLSKRINTEAGNTEDITTGLIGRQQRQLDEAINKTLAEQELLTQKKLTELGQTQDITSGTIGKQQALYEAQKEGFYRDAEQKASKIFADAFSVLLSTGNVANPLDYGLDGPTATTVLEKLKAGVGVT